MQKIELFAPNGLPITGVRCNDGSVRKFSFSYNKAEKVSMYSLEDGTSLPEGALILQDSSGDFWQSSDVEWHTLFERK